MIPLEGAILCRATVSLPSTVTGEMMYMPGGMQKINPFDGGIDQPIPVMVDAAAAQALDAQRSALMAKGKRPYFDFNHDDGEASFWPESFYWKDGPEPGIYCRGEWTADGKSKVEGKAWRQFSPVFHVDNKRGNPARIVCRQWAKPNMGGLVNDPAFHTILPLWAKNAAGAHPDDQNPTKPNQVMLTAEELAALQAKNKEQKEELDALKAKEAAAKLKQENTDLITSEIRAKNAEQESTAAKLELESLKAKNKTQGDAIAARNKSDAEAAVDRAIKRGAIAAKDKSTQDALVAKATEDPSFNAVIDAMQGHILSGRITPSGVTLTQEAPNAVIKEYAALVCRNSKIPLTLHTSDEKGKLARQAAAIFAKDIEADKVIATMSMDDAIKAADNTDASVGLLSGTLVLQRALPMLMFKYPILSSVTTDFSDAPGLFNQTEVTRIILKPAVQSYDSTPDVSGRPKGWTTVSPAQSVDVPIKLDEHVGVPIVFGQATLSQTLRNLFAETAPMALYALGGYAVNKLTALMTPANFNAYAGIAAAAGVTTNGSTAITVTSTANMYPGQAISGTGIPVGAHIASVTDATHAVLTLPATADGAGLAFVLSDGKVPTPYATYVKQLADFNLASLTDIRVALTNMEVPAEDRFALLNASYYGQLSNDRNFNTFFAAMRKPEIVTDGALPRLQGFDPQEAPWFPSSNNRVGFAGNKAALALKSRLPADFTNAVGAQAPGSVTTVTAPGGISVLLVQRVDLTGNYAEWRPEVYLGAAVGDRRCGMVLTSA